MHFFSFCMAKKSYVFVQYSFFITFLFSPESIIYFWKHFRFTRISDFLSPSFKMIPVNLRFSSHLVIRLMICETLFPCFELGCLGLQLSTTGEEEASWDSFRCMPIDLAHHSKMSTCANRWQHYKI